MPSHDARVTLVEAEVVLIIKFGDRKATSKQVRTVRVRAGNPYDSLDAIESMVHDAQTAAENEVLK